MALFEFSCLEISFQNDVQRWRTIYTKSRLIYKLKRKKLTGHLRCIIFSNKMCQFNTKIKRAHIYWFHTKNHVRTLTYNFFPTFFFYQPAIIVIVYKPVRQTLLLFFFYITRCCELYTSQKIIIKISSYSSKTFL